MEQFRKLFRYVLIYGPFRAFFKTAGRMRWSVPMPSFSSNRDTGVIGCGQYSFATIGYFVWRRYGSRFKKCFDTNLQAADTFARFYGAEAVGSSQEIFQDESILRIVIASNHASHSEYAVQALKHGKSVYVEKPIATSLEQLSKLKTAVAAYPRSICFGFNRPFSEALSRIHEARQERPLPITLSCFITGHVLESDHWYRQPGEGTRICGNVAHWLDLAVHILSWNDLPDRWQIAVSWASADARDDNLAITLTSDRGDLVNIVMTSRDEPFEGINETINLQVGPLIAKIDDFRELKIWNGSRYSRHRIWPKDVGHRNAILQLFGKPGREWGEVESSALLILHIKDMVESALKVSDFSFSTARKRLAEYPQLD